MSQEKWQNEDILEMDSSAAVTDRRGMKYVTGTTAKNCDTAGEPIDGVSVSGGVTAAGEAVGILAEDFPLVESGAAYADQAQLTVDNQGRFVTAGVGDTVDADAMEAATAAGEKHPVRLRQKAQKKAGNVVGALRTVLVSPDAPVLLTDEVLIVNLTVAGAVAINLPAGEKYAYLVVKDGKGDAGVNNITITANGAEKIDTAATKVINANFGSVRLVHDGSNWFTV